MALINNIPHTTATEKLSTNLIITVTCEDGYLLDGDVTISYPDIFDEPTTGKLTVSEDKKSAKGVANTDTTDTQVTITGNTVADPSATKAYSPTVNDLTNCTADGLKDQYTKGDSVDITLTADAGTKFKQDTPPTIEWYFLDDTGLQDINVQNFTVSEDGSTATFNGVIDDSVRLGSNFPITLSGGAYSETTVFKPYGSINVYVVTNDNLEAFAKERFIDTSGTSIDYGTFVSALFCLYADVPTGGKDVIKCGNLTTQISVDVPSTDNVNIDFGAVTIPLNNGDMTDFQSEVNVFLPFVGFESVPSEYIGKEISLTADINIVDGSGVYKMAYNGITFAVYDFNPFNNVAYRTADNDYTVHGYNDGSNNTKRYGLQPFIVMKWYAGIDTQVNRDNRQTTIGECTGYCEFSDISDTIGNANMLKDEQEEIYTLLQAGVYI